MLFHQFLCVVHCRASGDSEHTSGGQEGISLSDPQPAETDRGAHCTGKHFTTLGAALTK